MVTEEYSEAAVEVLGIIDALEEEEQSKIPKEIIEFLEKNKSETYCPDIDYFDNIETLNLKEKTRQILAGIYLDYLCNEEEREEYTKKLKENEIKYQEELKQIYNTDNLFNNKKNNDNQTTELIIKKETLFNKIIKGIKRLFKIK